MTSWYGAMLLTYGCLHLLLGMQQAAASTLINQESEPDSIQEYHLERMPLEKALERFTQQTGVSLLYESSVLGHRYSQAVHGRMSAIVALQRLLTGTPITIQSLHNRSYLLSAEPAERPLANSKPSPHSPNYDRQVQQSILKQLCLYAAPLIQQHRVAVRIVIDRQGYISVAIVSVVTRAEQEPYLQELLQGLYVGIVPYGVEPSAVWLIDQSLSPQAPVCS